MYISSPLILPSATPAGGILIDITAERGGLAGLILLSTQGPSVTLEVSDPSSGEFAPVTALPRRLEAGQTLRLTRTDTSALSSTINAILLPDEGAEPEFPAAPGETVDYPTLRMYDDNYITALGTSESGEPQAVVYAIPISAQTALDVGAMGIEIQESTPNPDGPVQAALFAHWPPEPEELPLAAATIDAMNLAASVRLNGLRAQTYFLVIGSLAPSETSLIVTPQLYSGAIPDNNWQETEFGGRSGVLRSSEAAPGNVGRRRFVPFSATGAGTLSVELYSTFSVNSTLQATLHPAPGVSLPGQVDMVTGPTSGWTTVNIPIPQAGDFLLNMWPYVAEAQEDNFVYVDLSSLQFTAT